MHVTPPVISCSKLLVQTQPDRSSGAPNPLIAVQEGGHRVPGGVVAAGDGSVSGPAHPGGGVGAGALVVVLGVGQRLEAEVAVPGEVSVAADEVADLRLHDDCVGVLAPGAAEVAADGELVGDEAAVGDDAAVVDDEAGGLVAVGAALRGDDVLLVVERAADDEDAVLEDGGGVAEDEVDGAGDDAVAVELPHRVRVERVLVALHPAVQENGPVRLHAQRHRLVLDRPCRVAESYARAHEPIPMNSYGGPKNNNNNNLDQKAPVFGHNEIRREIVLSLPFESSPLFAREPSRKTVAAELPPLLGLEEAAAPAADSWDVKRGEERRCLSDDRQCVARQVLRGLHPVLHFLLQLSLREPLDARLLVRDNRAQPYPQLVPLLREVVEPVRIYAIHCPQELGFRVPEQLLAVVDRGPHAGVVALDAVGDAAEGLVDLVGDRSDGRLDQVLGRGGGVRGGLREGLLARLLVVGRRAEHLDGLGDGVDAAVGGGGGGVGGRAARGLGRGLLAVDDAGGADDDEEYDGGGGASDHEALALRPLLLGPLDQAKPTKEMLQSPIISARTLPIFEMVQALGILYEHITLAINIFHVTRPGSTPSALISLKRLNACSLSPHWQHPEIIEFHDTSSFTTICSKNLFAELNSPHFEYIANTEFTRWLPSGESIKPNRTAKECNNIPTATSPVFAHACKILVSKNRSGITSSPTMRAKSPATSSHRCSQTQAPIIADHAKRFLSRISSNTLRASSKLPHLAYMLTNLAPTKGSAPPSTAAAAKEWSLRPSSIDSESMHDCRREM
ncbi:hypothetical protein ACMD2_15403 [Ananas comosus]|uniref:Uncharacterized protein n=1 Tax=Ananas comosus TaxID=4615 RepID=A0A199W5Q3_ANACO|nr:hypothetical protein ACMD2_15403 [Ananas comosus]